MTENPHKLVELHRRLADAGFGPIKLEESDDGEMVTYKIRQPLIPKESVNYNEDYAAMLGFIRAAGYAVGVEELAMNFDGFWLAGSFLTRPLAEICTTRQG